MHKNDSGPDKAHFFRTPEIEEWTNAVFIHPLSEYLSRSFDRLGLHPNVVSVAGMAFGVAAGFAYHELGNVWAYVAGFLLMIGWHVLDGADGQLARLSGKTSETGKALDGLADHVAFAAVYIGLATALVTTYGPAVWIIVIGAGLSHVLQAAGYEHQRNAYDYVVRRKSTARVPTPAEYRQQLSRADGLSRLFRMLYLAYLYIQQVASRADGTSNTAVERLLRNASDPDAVRVQYRRVHLDVVRAGSMLCSNYRTIAIFIFCLAGLPLYYFVYEIIVLNVVLVFLTHMQQRRNEMLQEWIADVVHDKAA